MYFEYYINIYFVISSEVRVADMISEGIELALNVSQPPEAGQLYREHIRTVRQPSIQTVSMAPVMYNTSNRNCTQELLIRGTL